MARFVIGLDRGLQEYANLSMTQLVLYSLLGVRLRPPQQLPVVKSSPICLDSIYIYIHIDIDRYI